MKVGWYARRLASMDPVEAAGRARDVGLQWRWRGRQISDPALDATAVPDDARIKLPAPSLAAVPADARQAVLAAADGLLEGRWPVFDRVRDDMAPEPDWFLDPRTGRRSPSSAYCFAIDHRDEASVGNVKYVWEASRHSQCTVLATAYRLTGDDAYAEAAAAQLRSWWHANPFLSGIHWTSGIELGLRLIAWTWTRRLLDGWSQVHDVFERNPVFLRQLHHHQEWLAAFPSRGSSANNHLVAEAAGQFIAAAAFDVFDESAVWRERAARTLRAALPAQVFACGLHRELASEYHGFVLELALVAALEGEVQGHPLGAAVWHVVCRMTDALAATVDRRTRPPRQGDADEGHGLLVDAPDYDRWSSLLATGGRLFGRLPWWPPVTGSDVRTSMLSGLVSAVPVPDGRPAQRPSLFAEAGQILLRDHADAGSELWCRFDAGPHGLAGIAAHAHADALSIEVRVDGVDVLADPGTYCYHGERRWRDHFRSTSAHNTIQLDDVEQSVMGGPFLWTSRTDGELLAAGGLEQGTLADATARHAGYRRLNPPAVHVRTVRLHRGQRWLRCIDEIASVGAHGCRLTFVLGPQVDCTIDGALAELSWLVDGRSRRATLLLPDALRWSVVHGEDDPIGGWYSPGFGEKRATVALVGRGVIEGGQRLVSELHPHPVDTSAGRSTVSAHAGGRRQGGLS